MQVPADSSSSIARSAERLWTARIVRTALEEGLAKMDMAIATYGRREPLSLFCYGEPGTGKAPLAGLFIDRYRPAERPGRLLYVLLPGPSGPPPVPRGVVGNVGGPIPSRATVC